MIDPRLITFLTVARIKSFTKAGEVLNLTQPAVSQHIKFLEQHFGVPLVRKTGKQIEITEEGQVLLKYAKNLESISAALQREIRNKTGIVKRYRAGATMTIGEFVLPEILGNYKEAYKNVDIILEVNNTQSMMAKLLNREIDMALIEGPFDRKKFKYHKLMDDELVLAVSPNSHLANRTSINLEEIFNEKLILREEGSGTRKVFENKLHELGYSLKDLKVYMEIGSINAIKSLVESNLGYTIISQKAIEREVSKGTIRIIPIEGIAITREFNFIYLKDGPVDFIKDFINFCCARQYR